jgi:hypothetical protein
MMFSVPVEASRSLVAPKPTLLLRQLHLLRPHLFRVALILSTLVLSVLMKAHAAMTWANCLRHFCLSLSRFRQKCLRSCGCMRAIAHLHLCGGKPEWTAVELFPLPTM